MFEKKCVVLTDCEDAIRSLIKEVFPTISLLRCWNHFFKAVERWILAHGGTIADVGWYIESLRELLLQHTKEAFFNLLEEKNGYKKSLEEFFHNLF